MIDVGKIRDKAEELCRCCESLTDIELDKALGEIEALIYEARQAISDEWRAARIAGPKKLITNIDLKELGL